MRGGGGKSKSSSAVGGGGGGVGLIAGVAGASLLSGAGGTTISTCKDEDTSFYCKFTRGFNIFKMILSIVAFLVIAFVLYKIFLGSKSKTK